MKNVLIVEDNRLERKLLAHMLDVSFPKQFNIEVCEDGEQASLRLNQQVYDLVVTDIIMPRIEGIELIRRVKSDFPSTRIIAISGSNPYYLYLAKKLGTDGIFTKPIDKNKFIQLVCTTLNIHPDFGLISA